MECKIKSGSGLGMRLYKSGQGTRVGLGLLHTAIVMVTMVPYTRAYELPW